MTATDELRKLLDERGVEYEAERIDSSNYFTWGENDCYSYTEYPDGTVLRIWDCTPEQAVAATLGSDDDYEAKMDALLCRLTNGKWSKSRAYDLDFMESCIDEEYEKAYEDELAVTTQGAAEIVRCRDCKWFTSEYWYEEERGFGLTEIICEPPDCGNPIRCATTYDSLTNKFVPIHIITEPDGYCAWAERREQ